MHSGGGNSREECFRSIPVVSLHPGVSTSTTISKHSAVDTPGYIDPTVKHSYFHKKKTSILPNPTVMNGTEWFIGLWQYFLGWVRWMTLFNSFHVVPHYPGSSTANCLLKIYCSSWFDFGCAALFDPSHTQLCYTRGYTRGIYKIK